MSIDEAKLRAVRTIISHQNCPDGIASAILLHDALPNATIRFLQYNTEEHKTLPAEPNLLFCDFSPPEARVAEFVEAGAIVLDHHKSARGVVEAFGPNGVFADETTQPGVSGAILAFLHVWQHLVEATDSTVENAYNFALLAGVRDTWQKQSPLWRNACAQAAVLLFLPWIEWEEMKRPFWHGNDGLWADRMQLGELLLKNREEEVRKTLIQAYRHTSPSGVRVVMFNNISITSDAAEATGFENADIVVGFSYRVDPDTGASGLVISMRSPDPSPVDVSLIATKNGGGGHKRAAGYILSHHQFGDGSPYFVILHSILPYME